MVTFKNHLLAVVAIGGILLFITFAKIPPQVVKFASLVGKTFKQVVLRGKPSYTEGFDVITSASIRVGNSDSTREGS